MKRVFSVLLVGAALAGCTDSRGRIDPLGTGLLLGGGGLLAGTVGGAVARSHQPNPYRYGGIYGGRPYYRDSGIGYAPGGYGRCSYIGGCGY